jgi:hypothetical protein
MLKTIGFELTTMNNNKEELKINLYGKAEDELDLIITSITSLIKQIDDEYPEKKKESLERIQSAIKMNLGL